MSVRREIGLALLLGAALTVAVVTGRRGADIGPLLDRRASTLLTGPEGARALYEVLAALGRPVERRRRPLFDLARDSLRRPALLVLLDPPVGLEVAELRELVEFVHRGGHVLAAGWGGRVTACAGWRLEPPGSLTPDTLDVAAPRPGPALPAVAHVLRRGARAGAEGRRPEDAPKRRFDADDKSYTGCDQLAAAGEDTLLATTDGRPVVLQARYPGGGSITLAADADYFRNRVWRAGAVPPFALPLLTPPPAPPGRRGRVSWDEYHQGFGRAASVESAVAGWLARAPGGWAILQLVAVALAALAVAAVRFGPAQGVIERRRRSPLEHLEALAAGLEGAAGVDTAVDLTIAGLRRRLSRTGMHAPMGDGRQWLARLELALASPRGRAAVRSLRAVITQPGGAERVLAAAHAVEDVWQELRPRTTRD